jgi:hypothetical protein
MIVYGGKMLTDQPIEDYVRSVLLDIGFGPYIRTWAKPDGLPANWDAAGRLDASTWPAEQVWFEADWYERGRAPIPEDPNFAAHLAGLKRAWRLHDVLPYCWSDNTRPAEGVKWCNNVLPYQPPPPPPQPDPPQPDPPQPQPGPPAPNVVDSGKESSFSWASALIWSSLVGLVGVAGYFALRGRGGAGASDRGPDLYAVNPVGDVLVRDGRLVQYLNVTELSEMSDVAASEPTMFPLEYQLYEPDGRAVSKGSYEGPGHTFWRDGALWVWLGRVEVSSPVIYRTDDSPTLDSNARLDQFIAGLRRALSPKRAPRWPSIVPSETWADGFRDGIAMRKQRRNS